MYFVGSEEVNERVLKEVAIWVWDSTNFRLRGCLKYVASSPD